VFVFYGKRWQLHLGIALLVVLLGAMAVRGLYVSEVFQQQKPIYQGSSARKWVSVTINVDWGEEYLPGMLDYFKKQKVRATFFVTGRWAEEHPQLLRRIASSGCDLGNHGYEHAHVNQLTLGQNIDEINKTNKIIYAATGKKTKFFAPPYGEFNQIVLDAAERTGQQTTLWTVDTVDWQNPPAETIISRVTDKVHNGAIILMHPTKGTVEALPGILAALQEQGYQIVPLEKLIAD
jgi:probable sporulation protein (polysaccharide deacetylase family)